MVNFLEDLYDAYESIREELTISPEYNSLVDDEHVDFLEGLSAKLGTQEKSE